MFCNVFYSLRAEGNVSLVIVVVYQQAVCQNLLLCETQPPPNFMFGIMHT